MRALARFGGQRCPRSRRDGSERVRGGFDKVSRLPDSAKRFLWLALFSFVILSAAASNGAHARLAQTNRGAKPTPTPIVVPRRPSQSSATPRTTPTPARVVVVPAETDA